MVMKYLRKKKTAKKIWIVLIIIILPAFVLWGLGSASRAKNKANYAGKIFGKKVSFQEYANAYNAVLVQGVMRWGEENFQNLAKTIDLKQEAWSRLILVKEAQREKIRVSDKELAVFIENSDVFQYKGKFDIKAYKEILQFVLRTSVPVFENQMRENLMIAKLFNKVTAQVKLSDEQMRQADKASVEQLLFKEKEGCFNKFLEELRLQAKFQDNTQNLKIQP